MMNIDIMAAFLCSLVTIETYLLQCISVKIEFSWKKSSYKIKTNEKQSLDRLIDDRRMLASSKRKRVSRYLAQLHPKREKERE